MINKICNVCKKSFHITLSLKRIKYCSRSCYFKSRLGYKHSQETKEKMRQTQLGHIVSQETRKKLSIANKGYQHTIEAKKKMSIARKGKKCPWVSEMLKKRNTGKFGPKSNNWKGGRIKTDKGYIEIWQPYHPLANKRGYIYEHRLIMERHLKRFLKSEEIVHHKNRLRDDNRLENLEVFKNSSEHSKYHLEHNHIKHF